MKATILPLLIATLLLNGCDNPTLTEPDQTVKEKQVSQNNAPTIRDEKFAGASQGAIVFQENCQVCHGVAAAGLTKDWQKSDADGNYPAPPLNGTAHAWHHDQKTLLSTINRGGIPLGGTMPAFKDKLSEDQKLAVLAYIKSLWPDKLYEAWRERNEGK